ncbi:MAG TPA: hypothetical protein VL523_09820 [Terriglobia bacterium]|nr:hypothetical protein [Terriglobia bacterium]
MQFTLNHQRQTIGQQIQVSVSAGSNETISEVITQFDGFTIGDDTLAGGSTQYDRTFDGQSATLGATHTLVVFGLDQNRTPNSATKIWTDAS